MVHLAGWTLIEIWPLMDAMAVAAAEHQAEVASLGSVAVTLFGSAPRSTAMPRQATPRSVVMEVAAAEKSPMAWSARPNSMFPLPSIPQSIWVMSLPGLKSEQQRSSVQPEPLSSIAGAAIASAATGNPAKRRCCFVVVCIRKAPFLEGRVNETSANHTRTLRSMWVARTQRGGSERLRVHAVLLVDLRAHRADPEIDGRVVL